MLCLSARTYEKDEAARRFTLAASFDRTVLGQRTKESVYVSNEDGKTTFHIYFHHRKDEVRWVDFGLRDGEVRFYDCDAETFKSHIGAMCYCGEISTADWRKLDEIVWLEEKRGIEY